MAELRAHRFNPEAREQAVRLVRVRFPHLPFPSVASLTIAPKMSGTKETLRRWLRQTERNAGAGAGPTREDEDRLAALGCENHEQKRVNNILRKARVVFAAARCPL
jgi:transposase